MSVAYTKIPLGNGTHVVEWELSADRSEVDGAPLELANYDVASIQARTIVAGGSGIVPRMYHSNFGSGLDVYAWKISLKTVGKWSILIPGDAPLPPATRLVFPRLEANNGAAVLRVAMLLREV